MSTRSQIKFKNSEFNIHIYKHSDGYPEYILPKLIPFTVRFFKERGLDEAYFLAQFIRKVAIQDYIYDESLEFYKKNPEYHSENSLLGWGLDCVQHGDIEYLYEIGDKGEIYVNGKKLTKTQLNKYLTNEA